MDPRVTLRNVSEKDPPILLGCHEIWAVDFEDRQIGMLTGSPVSGSQNPPDIPGPWLWHAFAYWGDARPVPAWAKVPLGGAPSKESAAADVLDYHITCKAAAWKPGCWGDARASRAVNRS